MTSRASVDGARSETGGIVRRRGVLAPLPLSERGELEVAWLGRLPEWLARAESAGGLRGARLRRLVVGDDGRPAVVHVASGEVVRLPALRATFPGCAAVLDCTAPGTAPLGRRAARSAAAAALVLVGSAVELGEVRRLHPRLAARSALLRPPVDLDLHGPPELQRRARPADVETFLAGQRGLPPPLLFPGPVREGSGLDLLVSAVGLLRDRLDDVRVAVISSGATDGAFLARCRRRAAALGVPLVQVPRGADVALWYAFSEVICLPGRRVFDAEPARLAAAAGRPLVAGEAASLLEAVEEGETAWVVPPDARQLAEALHALLADEEARRRLGRAARRKAERELSPAVAAGRLVELWRRAAAAARERA